MTPQKYYHAYVESFVGSLIPPGKTSVCVRGEDRPADGAFDYFVATDALGQVRDVEDFLRKAETSVRPDGRFVITQYNALWEPLLRLASRVGLRRPNVEQNWLSLSDLENLFHLSGLEVLETGSRMLLPAYIPLVSAFFNTWVIKIWPFSKMGIFHYVIAKKSAVVRAKSSISNPSFSIIVPARNEAGTIEKIARELPNLGAFTEIIFIEGNSTDNTFDEINRVAALCGKDRKIIFDKQKGKGKGDAVRKGFDKATGDILAIYDADMTVPPEEVEKFYRALVTGRAEFANGSRLVYPVEKGAMRVLNLVGNKFFSKAFSWLLSQPLKDTLCGTKVLWKKDYEEIQKNRAYFGDFDPFGDFDLLFGAARLGLKIVDVPVHYRDRIYGETNIKRWSHGWLLLKMTVFAARKIKFK